MVLLEQQEARAHGSAAQESGQLAHALHAGEAAGSVGRLGGAFVRPREVVGHVDAAAAEGEDGENVGF